MTSVRFWLLLMALSLVVSPCNAGPAARARASLGTQGDIWVGQRVILVIELATPGYFSSAATFEIPQVPGVIVMPPSDRPVIGSVTEGDETLTTQRHELAVYSQHGGEVKVPPIPVRFDTTAAYGKPVAQQRVTTNEVTFSAKMPPGAESLATVITTSDLKATQAWEPELKQAPLKLGSAITRKITVEAQDVPGMVLPPFHSKPVEGLGAYPKAPTVNDRVDRGTLTGQRIETVTYVCEKPGTYSLPTFVLAWWDPEKKQLQRIELPGKSIEVSAPPQPPAEDAVAAQRPPSRSWWIAAAAVVLCSFVGGAWLLAPAIKTHWAEHRTRVAESEATWFAKFKHACHNGDPRAVETALLEWLDRFCEPRKVASIEQFAESAGSRTLETELAALQAAVYARPDSSRAAWSPHKLLHEVSEARTQILRAKNGKRVSATALPPLNPVA